VDAYPDHDSFTVEVADDDGRTVELKPAHRKELRVVSN
jgi:hypothetical protein